MVVDKTLVFTSGLYYALNVDQLIFNDIIKYFYSCKNVDRYLS